MGRCKERPWEKPAHKGDTRDAETKGRDRSQVQHVTPVRTLSAEEVLAGGRHFADAKKASKGKPPTSRKPTGVKERQTILKKAAPAGKGGKGTKGQDQQRGGRRGRKSK